ncbi:similar to Saccharomyces cerevisiae YDR479C PEX29 Peroxisomal integral membrane peroxin, involved in the regulation of peroxisomal size, number and distribution [Maudiozyma saulgeensis]|uniref:Similar to Saccharomyces cerevisiae YDR479C PEX29 Peroxisomal integral membrane peroxin, involved in the regulation of peroxisomal size, number and distribution n=1 Tax=Maudiozyma saulgeensis TaxID=1789683 RepID=A0A1X7R9I5_9SACH|nr:similar to Saccharomyces cerevisiae YDR479C PEX29 Peroxisomal integral membrane peroxin, involved in the regulation of peroxisomal size, number and distribution [Kazachstania saulgeensis]
MDSVTNFFWNEESQGKDPKTLVTPSNEQDDTFKQRNVVNSDNTSLKKQTSGNTDGSKSGNTKSTKDKKKYVAEGSKDGSTSLQQMMTDTLVEKVIKMALPPTSDSSRINIEQRSVFSKTRPSMSVQIMSNNFIQMNSRLSIPFIMINEVIRLMSWENVPFTLSILLVITFAILKPLVTATSGPLFYILFGIMVPKYMYVHKPNKIKNLKNNNTPAQGPALRKPAIPEPVPELSQEFVLNLTDLQNHMLLYVWLYDTINSFLLSFAYFVNEQISCLVFILLLLVAILNLLFIENIAQWVPIKFILVLFVWGFVIAMHPNNRELILKQMNSEETRLKTLSFIASYETLIKQHLRYVEAKENKLVKVYEIQKYRETYKEWRTVGFSNDDYCLFSDLRIKELNISDYCTKLLDDVLPPSDWEWVPGSSWVLDLNPHEWVEDNFIQNVEIDSETKWVYDVDFDGFRGKYRRRMWTNMVTRIIQTKDTNSVNVDKDDGEQVIEEVVNPLREEISNRESSFHGVARDSLAGAHNSSMISEGNRMNDSLLMEGDETVDSSLPNEGSFNGINDMTDFLNTAV